MSETAARVTSAGESSGFADDSDLDSPLDLAKVYGKE